MRGLTGYTPCGSICERRGPTRRNARMVEARVGLRHRSDPYDQVNSVFVKWLPERETVRVSLAPDVP